MVSRLICRAPTAFWLPLCMLVSVRSKFHLGALTGFLGFIPLSNRQGVTRSVPFLWLCAYITLSDNRKRFGCTKSATTALSRGLSVVASNFEGKRLGTEDVAPHSILRLMDNSYYAKSRE